MAKPNSLAALAAQTTARAATISPAPKKQAIMEPTAEQRRHANYVEQDIVDVLSKGRVTLGKAYRKKARFETIEGLGMDQLKALRAYRAAFDASEQSEVKSSLDIRPRGAGGAPGALTSTEARAYAAETLRRIESSLGALVHTLRDVVLLDMTFSEAAMKRFGSREVDYIDIGMGKRKPRSVVKLVPKSGTHRQIVRDEFFQALAKLVAAVNRLQPKHGSRT
jgi:hypothetical protein